MPEEEEEEDRHINPSLFSLGSWSV